MEERGQFTFYRSFYEAIEEVLPRGEREKILWAVIQYGLDRKLPRGLNAQEKGIFRLVRPVLDTAWRKAEAGAMGASVTNSKRAAKSRQGDGKAAAKSRQACGKKEIEKEIDIEIDTESDIDGPAGEPGGGTGAAQRSDFDVFFDSYPNAVGREGVKEAWDEVVTDAGAVLESLQKWKQSPQWHRDGGRFVPRAEKWLRERWFEARPREMANSGALGEPGEAEMAAIRAIMGED